MLQNVHDATAALAGIAEVLFASLVEPVIDEPVIEEASKDVEAEVNE
jgi:hypothetical protein